MKRIFLKYETLFSMLLIALYISLNSFCINSFGITDFRSALINTALSVFLLILAISLKRVAYYGLKKPQNARKLLYFLPLLLIISVNFWGGISIKYSAREAAFYIITMLNVGFIEEMIFRGFLFKMMAKDNLSAAVTVSSVTFGIGHIINIFNGAELLPTLLQVCFAVSAGFLFVIIFHKSGSLLPVIITHSLNNALSFLTADNTVTKYIAPIFLTVFPIIYILYICKSEKKSEKMKEQGLCEKTDLL